MTKSDMVNEKHQIKKFNILMTRFIIFHILIVFLFVLPDPLIFIMKLFGFSQEYVKKNVLPFAIIVAKLTVVLIFLLSKMQFKTKHIINMFLLTLLMVVLISFVIKEIIIIV